jgi:hypothetical protein
VAACQRLKQGTRSPTLVKYSLAASSIDAANLVGRELKLGRDRLVPEFTFMDPRGVGAWDMSNRTTTLSAVWALDNDEAGRDGLQGRPPATEDGTPHEVLADQAVRLRQVMSILESQFSGETILFIFPDGTGPALLSAMMAGIPYNRVHELEFGPGEVRFDVTMDSTLALWKAKQLAEGEAYQAELKRGRENLKRLRATAKNGGTVVNLKDQKLEEERIAIDKQMREKELMRDMARKKEQERRLQRQREVEAQRGESSVSPTVVWGAAGIAVLGGVATLGVASERDAGVPDAVSRDSSEASGLSATGKPIPEVDRVASSGLYASSTAGSRQPKVASDPSGILAAEIIIDKEVDPKNAADQAMEAYMNKDDGADDWLMSLSQIIEEADEDDDLIPPQIVVVPEEENGFQ